MKSVPSAALERLEVRFFLLRKSLAPVFLQIRYAFRSLAMLQEAN
jgi:hypothetical protein